MRDACGGRLTRWPNRSSLKRSIGTFTRLSMRSTNLDVLSWEDCSIEVGVMQSTSIALHRVGVAPPVPPGFSPSRVFAPTWCGAARFDRFDRCPQVKLRNEPIPCRHAAVVLETTASTEYEMRFTEFQIFLVKTILQS